jgi:hypothetical protein
MNKQFEYRGYKFNIKVELNVKTERSLNGRTWHKMTTNSMGNDGYYREEEVENRFFEGAVMCAEQAAQEYANGKIDGKPTQNEVLTKLGFT